MSRRFTLPEAESLLPAVQKNIREALSVKTQYQESEEFLQSIAQRVMLMGGVLLDREAIRDARTRRDESGQRLKAALDGLQEIGCVVKDLDIGLVDFPTLFRGEEVYLCWKLGETGITFWHGVSEGFAGRKPIDQDFLDHHRGDATN
jgi:hypothetical protein